MYKIRMEKECGCFKKSGMPSVLEFESKEDAVMRAKVLECKMNQEFCFKHYFEAVDHGDEIVIHSTVRPDDDDDDGIELKELLAKQTSPVVHFDEKKNPEDDIY
jgi:hypothetical protein